MRQTGPKRPLTALSRYRQRRVRHQVYRRRRLSALLALLCLGAGLFYGGRSVYRTWHKPAAPAEAGPPLSVSGRLPFNPESRLPGPDLDGDGVPEQIALGPAENALRKVALTTGGTGSAERVIGQVVVAADFPLAVRDLPRARNTLVQSGALPVEGESATVKVHGARAVLAAGGEPDFRAWRLDSRQGLVAVDYYALAAPMTPPAPDALLADKHLNVLWQYINGELRATYRITTGRHLRGPAPTAVNQGHNYSTPVGRYTIANKSLARPYYQENIPAGDLRNPLGTRWIGISVYAGDGANLWGIHGTNEPDKIGRWASDGCIRLTNAEIEQLYETVTPGKTMLEIIDSSQ